MTAPIGDITPGHNPVALMREALERAQQRDCRAGVVVLVDEDGHLWWESCGHQKMEVLWALEHMKMELLKEGTKALLDPDGCILP